MADRSTVFADRIKTILDQYPDVPAEVRSRLEGEVKQMLTPTDQELLPPNIPVNPESLRRQLESMAASSEDEYVAERYRQAAAAVPAGHPGVDYQDGDAENVSHAPAPDRTKIGSTTIDSIDAALYAQAD